MKEEYPLKSELIHIDNICSGDVILFDGHFRTVSKDNITNDRFMGKAIFGDSFKSGHTKIERQLFPHFVNGEFVGHAPQR